MIPVDANRITEQTFLGATSSVQGSEEFVFLAARSRKVQSSDVAASVGLQGLSPWGQQDVAAVRIPLQNCSNYLSLG